MRSPAFFAPELLISNPDSVFIDAEFVHDATGNETVRFADRQGISSLNGFNQSRARLRSDTLRKIIWLAALEHVRYFPHGDRTRFQQLFSPPRPV